LKRKGRYTRERKNGTFKFDEEMERGNRTQPPETSGKVDPQNQTDQDFSLKKTALRGGVERPRRRTEAKKSRRTDVE